MESNLSKIELYFVIRWIQSKLFYTRFLAIEDTSLLCQFKFVYEIPLHSINISTEWSK